jgi:hypothetical protein
MKGVLPVGIVSERSPYVSHRLIYLHSKVTVTTVTASLLIATTNNFKTFTLTITGYVVVYLIMWVPVN